MNRYTNILFDLDGTLIDTKPGVLGSVKKAFAELSLTLPSDDVLDGFMGPPLSQCFTQVCGLDAQQTQKAITVFRRFYEGGGIYDAKPYDGIKELLRQLMDSGYNLGVATSKNERFASIVLKHCGLDSFFACVAGAPDSVLTSWTKTDSVLKAMNALDGANATNTVLIGDRKFDANGAAEAGIDSIGVLFGYGKIDELRKSPFKYITNDVKSLQELLLS